MLKFLLNLLKTIYFWKPIEEIIILKLKWTRSDEESYDQKKKNLWTKKEIV